MMINTFWPKFFVTCHFCVVYYLLQWLLSQCLMRSCGSWRRRSCAFSDGTAESQGGRSGWALPIVGNWSLDRSEKWPKTRFGHVTWFKQSIEFILGHVKLIQGVPILQIHSDTKTHRCVPSCLRPTWRMDSWPYVHPYLPIPLHRHKLLPQYVWLYYTFQNIDPRSDATWHLTSGGPPHGVHRKLLLVPGPHGNWLIQTIGSCNQSF